MAIDLDMAALVDGFLEQLTLANREVGLAEPAEPADATSNGCEGRDR